MRDTFGWEKMVLNCYCDVYGLREGCIVLHVHQASARHVSERMLEHMQHGRCLPVAFFQIATQASETGPVA